MLDLILDLALLLVLLGLVVATSLVRRRPLADVYRNDGDRLGRTAERLLVGAMILTFVVFMIVNNRCNS